MPRLLPLVCCALLLLTSGCATRLGDFTIISSKNVEISRVDLKTVQYKRNIQGSDGRFWFIFIPFGGAPNIENAVTDACNEGEGDFVTSATIYRISWWFIFGWESYEVEGDVGLSTGKGSRNIEGGDGKFVPVPGY